MTKADIFEQVSEKCGCSKRQSTELVESVLRIIKQTLESGENIKIAGFGSFEVKTKADRKGRNPQSGETITIKSRRIVTFKTSNILRTAINKQRSKAHRAGHI